MSGPENSESGNKNTSGGGKHREDERVAVSRPEGAALNDGLSDESFEAYLQRGSAVSQQYRAIEQEQPPQQLDASILARAQDALRDNPAHKYRQWKQWTVPVAIAASTVIAVSIVLESGMQHEVRDAASVSMMESESREFSREVASEPVSGTAQPTQPASAALPPATQRLSDGAIDSASTSTQSAAPSELAREQYLAVEAPPPPPAAPQAQVNTEVPSAGSAASAAGEMEERKARVMQDSALARMRGAVPNERAALKNAAPAPRVPPARAESAVASDSTAITQASAAYAPLRSPDIWLEEIRDLRKAGNDADADRQWRAFTTAYPDFEVAADDTARPLTSSD